MKNPLKKIEKMIQTLPEKDAVLAKKYLDKRDFQSVLELVDSDLYKADKDKYGKLEDIPDDYVLGLIYLRNELVTYMSYIEIPEDSEDYY